MTPVSPMRVLYLITARGGSKSIPKKNLARIGGLSLVGFKARAAQGAASCARLMISTDDPEIQDEARALGVDVPFTRPAELATDTASSDDVVRHAMDWVESQEGPNPYDAVMLLEPSSPFARSEDFDGAVRLMAEPKPMSWSACARRKSRRSSSDPWTTKGASRESSTRWLGWPACVGRTSGRNTR